MGLTTTRWRWVRAMAATVFVSLLLGLPANADGSSSRFGNENNGPKNYWQDRYRTLLASADRLKATIEVQRELYADANRRNYRRGDKRHRHHLKMVEAEEELAIVLEELSTIKDEGRRAGALPGWFYEVEDERSSPASRADAERESDDSGRNPLYSRDKDAN